MFLTLNETAGLIKYAIHNTASTLSISDIEWKTTDELLPLIKLKDNKTYDLLIDFIEAYSDWLGFHKNLERLGKTGILEPWDTQTLAQKTKKRDETREAILARLKQITS